MRREYGSAGSLSSNRFTSRKGCPKRSDSDSAFQIERHLKAFPYDGVMKRLARLIALAAFVSFPGASLPAYDQGGFLNFAIFNLPPEYFAGIPLEDRPALFQQKSSKPVANGLYYEQGYFYTSLESET